MLRFGDNLRHLEELFAARFEPEGESYLYRSGPKTAPIRVSVSERNDFIETYRNSLRTTYWISIAAGVLLLAVLAAYVAISGYDTGDGWLVASAIFTVLPAAGLFQWQFYAPARQLKGRTPSGEGRSSSEARRRAYAQYSYANSIATACIGSGIIGVRLLRHDSFDGWNILYLIAGIGLVLAAAVQAFLKWKITRED